MAETAAGRVCVVLRRKPGRVDEYVATHDQAMTPPTEYFHLD